MMRRAQMCTSQIAEATEPLSCIQFCIGGCFKPASSPNCDILILFGSCEDRYGLKANPTALGRDKFFRVAPTTFRQPFPQPFKVCCRPSHHTNPLSSGLPSNRPVLTNNPRRAVLTAIWTSWLLARSEVSGLLACHSHQSSGEG
jgi:hypothetical protein